MLKHSKVQKCLETLEDLANNGTTSQERMSEVLSLSEFELMFVVEKMCPSTYSKICGECKICGELLDAKNEE